MRNTASRTGFSLLELVISCGILVAIFGIAATAFTRINKLRDESQIQTRLMTEGRAILDILAEKITYTAGTNFYFNEEITRLSENDTTERHAEFVRYIKYPANTSGKDYYCHVPYERQVISISQESSDSTTSTAEISQEDLSYDTKTTDYRYFKSTVSGSSATTNAHAVEEMGSRVINAGTNDTIPIPVTHGFTCMTSDSSTSYDSAFSVTGVSTSLVNAVVGVSTSNVGSVAGVSTSLISTVTAEILFTNTFTRKTVCTARCPVTEERLSPTTNIFEFGTLSSEFPTNTQYSGTTEPSSSLSFLMDSYEIPYFPTNAPALLASYIYSIPEPLKIVNSLSATNSDTPLPFTFTHFTVFTETNDFNRIKGYLSHSIHISSSPMGKTPQIAYEISRTVPNAKITVISSSTNIIANIDIQVQLISGFIMTYDVETAELQHSDCSLSSFSTNTLPNGVYHFLDTDWSQIVLPEPYDGTNETTAGLWLYENTVTNRQVREIIDKNTSSPKSDGPKFGTGIKSDENFIYDSIYRIVMTPMCFSSDSSSSASLEIWDPESHKDTTPVCIDIYLELLDPKHRATAENLTASQSNQDITVIRNNYIDRHAVRLTRRVPIGTVKRRLP